MTKSNLDKLIFDAESDPESFEKWYAAAKYAIDRYIVGKGERCITEAVKLSPADPNVLDLMGKALNRRRHLDKAVKVYEKALDIAPDNPSLWTGLAVVKSHQGDFDASARYYQKALEIDPGFPWAISSYTARFSEKGDVSEALPIVERAVEVNPDSALNWACHYIVMKDLGRDAEARISLDRGIAKLKDAHPDNHRRAGSRLTDSDRKQDVIKILEEIYEEDPENINVVFVLSTAYPRSDPKGKEILEKAYEMDPESPLLRAGLASALAASGDVLGAMQMLKEVQEDSPEDPLSGVLQAIVFPHLDRKDMSDEDRMKALESARSLVQRAPLKVTPRIILANNLLSNFNFEEANMVADEIKGMEFKEADERYQFAVLLIRLGREEEALKQAERAVDGKEGSLEALFVLALTQIEAQKYSDLQDTLDRIVETEDDKQWLAIQGKLAWLRDEKEKAIEILTQASEAGIADSKITLAALVRKNDPDRANSLLREAEESSSKDDDFLSIKARALLGLGRDVEAREWLQKRVDTNPTDDVAWNLILLDAKRNGGRSEVKEQVRNMVKAMTGNIADIIPAGVPSIIGEMELIDQLTTNVMTGEAANKLQNKILSRLLKLVKPSESMKDN